MENMQVNLNQMEIETGIPKAEIEAALQSTDIPTANNPWKERFTSFVDALMALNEDVRNTDDAALVMQCMLEHASTLSGIVSVHRLAKEGSTERILAIKKAAKYFTE